MAYTYSREELKKLFLNHPSILATWGSELSGSPVFTQTILFSYYKNKFKQQVRECSHPSEDFPEYSREEGVKLCATYIVSVLVNKAARSQKDEDGRWNPNNGLPRSYFEIYESAAGDHFLDELSLEISRDINKLISAQWFSGASYISSIKKAVAGDYVNYKNIAGVVTDIATKLKMSREELLEETKTVFP